MSTLNQDLQATHKILQFIEASKQQGELILDQIPGLFAVINNDGEILRANSLLASCLGLDIEDLLYSPFASLFRKEEYAIFNSKLEQIRSGAVENLDFELNITTTEMESKTHLWYLSKFKNAKDTLYTVVGKDISELKAAQQNLLEIFSSVPLGILTIDNKGCVTGQVSAYTEVLMSSHSIVGKSVHELLFAKAQNLTKVERDTLEALVTCIGNRELIYSVVKDELPTRLEVQMDTDKALWFGVTYQPIVYEGIVHKVMLILQDITQLVRAEQLQKNQNLLEEANVARILQLKKMDSETQPIIFEELLGLFAKSEEAVLAADGRSLCRYLHGIKGCARVAGLKVLTELSHGTESVILGLLEGENQVPSEVLETQFRLVREEWGEIDRLYKALFGVKETVKAGESAQSDSKVSKELKDLFVEYNSLISSTGDVLKSRYLAREILLTLESYNQHPLSNLESVLVKNTEATALASSKAVRLNFDWDNAYLDKNSLSTLREALTHLLNNAVDHAIENSEERQQQGKFAEGLIRIQATDIDGVLTLRCIDDGRGFNIPKIRDLAIRRGICTLEVAMGLSDEEIVDLIFMDQFSSAEVVTEISGRGIGLAAVRRAIAELGGSVKAIKRPVGAEFEIVLPSERSRPSPKKEFAFAEVLDVLMDELNKLKLAGYDISMEMDNRLTENLSDYEMYGEADAVIFAVIQLASILSANKHNKLLLSNCANGILEIRMDGHFNQLSPSKKYILDVCSLYLQQHRGGLRFADGVVYIRFGYIKQQSPERARS